METTIISEMGGLNEEYVELTISVPQSVAEWLSVGAEVRQVDIDPEWSIEHEAGFVIMAAMATPREVGLEKAGQAANG